MVARNILLFITAVILFWLGAGRLLQDDPPPALQPATVQEVPPSPVPQAPTSKRLGDISLHSVEELQLLFNRVEQLVDRPRSQGEEPLVSLVLHGPEVEFFALKNYAQYRDVVDRAAKLAALGAVDISICRTRMREYGIEPEQVPSFLRQVPFGPAEVERLLEQGFVYM